jgi:hypothetical protein
MINQAAGKTCINGSVWPPRAVSGIGAIAKVLNATQQFFLHGSRPYAGRHGIVFFMM